MTIVFTHGPNGTVAGDLINQQAVAITKGGPAQLPVPNDAYLAFAKALSRGFASVGTFTALTGATAITVADINVTAASVILIYLLTAAGTVGAIPAVQTKTAGTGFTVKNTASDTSVYGYIVLNLL